MQNTTEVKKSGNISRSNKALAVLFLLGLLGACGGGSESEGESLGDGAVVASLFEGGALYYFQFPEAGMPSHLSIYGRTTINEESRIISLYYNWDAEEERWNEDFFLSWFNVENDGRHELIEGEWVFRSSNNVNPIVEINSDGDMLSSDTFVPTVYFFESVLDFTGKNLEDHFGTQELFLPEATFPAGSKSYTLNVVYQESGYFLNVVFSCESGPDEENETRGCHSEPREITFNDPELRRPRAAENLDELFFAAEESLFRINQYFADFNQDGTINFYESRNRETQLPLSGTLVTEVIDGVTIYTVEIPAEYNLGFENAETFYTLFEGRMVEGVRTIEGVVPNPQPQTANTFFNETAGQAVLDNLDF